MRADKQLKPLSLQRNPLAILKKQRQLLLMSVPLILYVIVFSYIPLWGWSMAFQDYNPGLPFAEQKWVGLKWFEFLFTDESFLLVLRNTIAMSVINLVLGTVTAIGLAILLNEVRVRTFKRLVQTISYLPHFLSWVIVAGLVATVLAVEDGVLNNILLTFGLIKEPVLWLSQPESFWSIVGATYVWKELGWNTIIYLAAIASIDPALYEAAQIDGCNRFRRIWHITLPSIKPTIIVLLILSIGRILDAGFELQYLLRNGLIKDVADTLDIFALTYGINLRNYSLGTASGMFKNVVNISLLLIANQIAKSRGEERLL